MFSKGDKVIAIQPIGGTIAFEVQFGAGVSGVIRGVRRQYDEAANRYDVLYDFAKSMDALFEVAECREYDLIPWTRHFDLGMWDESWEFMRGELRDRLGRPPYQWEVRAATKRFLKDWWK